MVAKLLIIVAFLCAVSARIILVEIPDNIPAVPIIPEESKQLVQETDPAASDDVLASEPAVPNHPWMRSPEARACSGWSCYNSCRLAGYNTGYCLYGGCICYR